MQRSIHEIEVATSFFLDEGFASRGREEVELEGEFEHEPQPSDNEEEEEAVYVNPRQYDRILKRRKARARLLAEGKLLTERQNVLSKGRQKRAKERTRVERGRFAPKDAEGVALSPETVFSPSGSRQRRSGGINMSLDNLSTHEEHHTNIPGTVNG